jgi:hypothetical protein
MVVVMQLGKCQLVEHLDLVEFLVLQEHQEVVEHLELMVVQVMMVQIVEGGGLILVGVLVQVHHILLQILQQFHRLRDFILTITMLMQLILIFGGQP